MLKHGTSCVYLPIREIRCARRRYGERGAKCAASKKARNGVITHIVDTKLVLLLLFCLGFSPSAQAADNFTYEWLNRCLMAAEAEGRPSSNATVCMKDAVRICEFAPDRPVCLSQLASASNLAANDIVSGLPASLPDDAKGAGFYEKRRAKVANPKPLLVCNPPFGTPAEHCDAMTAMWRFSSARALGRMVETMAKAVQ